MNRLVFALSLVLLLAGCTHAESQTVQIDEKTKGMMMEVKSSDTAVLLAAGSGEIDLDYTVDGIPLYKQLAEGLKEAGIASLRLEKDKTAEFQTIEEEWLDRIQAGINYLNKRYDKVYLVGHSLSAVIAPVFEKQVDGIILMAGAVSEIEEIYAAQMMKSADDAEKRQILSELDIILSLEKDSGFSWFGIPESWWISMDQLHLLQRLSEMKIPVLVLSASEDDLISSDEYLKYQEVFKNHPDAEFEQFNGLNHFFVEKNDVKICDSVIEKIAAWILAHSSDIIEERGAADEKSNINC